MSDLRNALKSIQEGIFSFFPTTSPTDVISKEVSKLHKKTEYMNRVAKDLGKSIKNYADNSRIATKNKPDITGMHGSAPEKPSNLGPPTDPKNMDVESAIGLPSGRSMTKNADGTVTFSDNNNSSPSFWDQTKDHLAAHKGKYIGGSAAVAAGLAGLALAKRLRAKKAQKK